MLLENVNIWRTQFLSGIGGGVFLGASIGLIASLARRQWGRVAILVAAGSTIAFFGGLSATKSGARHDAIWERHRVTVEQIIQIAPSLRTDEAFFLLLGVPESGDPFRHRLWFEYALQLSYPGCRVAGTYYRDDGTPAPGNNWTLTDGRWSRTTRGHPLIPDDLDSSVTIAMRLDGEGRMSLVRELGDTLPAGLEEWGRYAPLEVIGDGPPSAVAVRRYGGG